MGFLSTFTSLFSSSAPSVAQAHHDKAGTSHGDGNGASDGSEDGLHDRIHIDEERVEEVEEKIVTPKHAPRPVLPHSNAFEGRKKDNDSAEAIRSNGVTVDDGAEKKQGKDKSRPPFRPQSSWRPIPSASFRGQSPRVNVESRNVPSREATSMHTNRTGAKKPNRELEEAPGESMPRSRKAIGLGAHEQQDEGPDEKLQAFRKSKNLSNRRDRSSTQPAYSSIQQAEKAQKRSKDPNTITVSPVHITKLKPLVLIKESINHPPRRSIQLENAEEDSNVVALLNGAVRRKVDRLEKQQLVQTSVSSHGSVPSSQSGSWKAVNGSKIRSTPQVIIRSQPRPSLLSIAYTPSKAPKSATKLPTSKKPPSEEEGDEVSVSSEASSSSTSESEAQSWRAIAPLQNNKRKAFDTPGDSAPVKRLQTERKYTVSHPLGSIRSTQAAAIVRTTTPTAQMREPIFVPESTPQRILPPASIFRFRNSQTQSAHTPVSVPKATPSSSKSISITPARNNAHTRIVPPPSMAGSNRRQSLVVQSSNLRQSSIASFVSTGSSNGDGPSMSVVRPSQMSSAKVKHSIALEKTPSAKGKEPMTVSANFRERVDRLRDPSPPRSNVKRKRRMPIFDLPESPPTATSRYSHSNHANSNPNRASGTESKAGGQSSSRRVRAEEDDELCRITIKSDKWLLAKGLDDDTLQLISDAVTNFGRHQEMTQFELNALVQKSSLLGDQTVKDLWDEVCGQLPGVLRKDVYQVVRRNFHNFVRGPWSAEQDEELREAYDRSPGKWQQISEEINRFPEDARLRYRDHVSNNHDQKKDVWTLEEEEKLRSVYDEYIGRIRAEKAVSNDVELLNTSDESLIDWNAVSVAMGRTRNRLQCHQKWKRLMNREASESTRLGPLSDVPWRIEQAMRKSSRLSSTDKLSILRAIRDTGAASEEKVPWRLLIKDLGLQHDEMNLAVRVLFRNLRGCVEGHEYMRLQDILEFLIEKFEEVAPNEPGGFDRIHSSVIDASKATPASTPESQVAERSGKRYSLNITSAVRSSKKRLKTYSGSKLRYQQILPDEDEGSVVPVATSHTKKIRDRMRNSDQSANRFATPQPAPDDGEDIARELRMTWTNKSITPRAKKPIVKPRVSQTVVTSPEKSSREEKEDDQLNPSPPSEDGVDEQEEDASQSEDEEVSGHDKEDAVHSSDDEDASEEDNVEDLMELDHTPQDSSPSLPHRRDHRFDSYMEGEKNDTGTPNNMSIDDGASVSDEGSHVDPETNPHSQRLGLSPAVRDEILWDREAQSSDEESQADTESQVREKEEEQDSSDEEPESDQQVDNGEGEEEVEMEDDSDDEPVLDDLAEQSDGDDLEDIAAETATLLSEHANRPVPRPVSAQPTHAPLSRWQAVRVIPGDSVAASGDYQNTGDQANSVHETDIKDEETSDSEVLSSLPESRRDSKPPVQVDEVGEDDSSSSESEESEQLDEHDEHGLPNGYNISAGRGTGRSSQTSQRYWSPPPPPQESSEDEDSSSDDDEAGDMALQTPSLANGIQQELTSPSPSSHGEGSDQEMHGGSIAYVASESESVIAEDNQGSGLAGPQIRATQQAEDDHVITMNGWSPAKVDPEQDLHYTSASDDDEDSEEESVRKNSTPVTDEIPVTNGIDYPALPLSEDDSGSGSVEEEQQVTKPVSKKGGAWTFERWQQERDAQRESSSDDSDSDVSSIAADVVPRVQGTGRRESVEL